MLDYPSYLERWAWLGLTLLVLAFLSPSAVLVGLALWFGLLWKAHGWWRWVVAGLVLLGSWAGLVLLWGMLAAQLVALREAITGYTGIDTLLTRALPVWGEGTLLGPTIAGVVQLFRPPRLVRRPPTRPARSEQPTETPLRGVQRWRTQPSPAIMPDPPPDAPAEPSA